MNTSREQIQARLDQKRKELEELQRELEGLQRAELLELPSRVGLSSVEELVKVLMPLVRAGARSESPSVSHRRLRTRVTPAMRRAAIELMAGPLTSKQIAERVGISVSLVNKLKAAEGLTRPRS